MTWLLAPARRCTNRTSYVIAPNGRIIYAYSDLDWRNHVTNTLRRGPAMAGARTAETVGADALSDRSRGPGANFLQITPFMHVPGHLEAALAFFEDILGFATLFRMADYAYVEREGAGIRILRRITVRTAPRPAIAASLIMSTCATSTRSTPS